MWVHLCTQRLHFHFCSLLLQFCIFLSEISQLFFLFRAFQFQAESLLQTPAEHSINDCNYTKQRNDSEPPCVPERRTDVDKQSFYRAVKFIAHIGSLECKFVLSRL